MHRLYSIHLHLKQIKAIALIVYDRTLICYFDEHDDEVEMNNIGNRKQLNCI